jgi:surfactin synthase thioesterase subunit
VFDHAGQHHGTRTSRATGRGALGTHRAAWWWWPAGTHPEDRPVLFFPPAGAEQGIVRPLLPHAAALRLGVLRMPGRGVRRDEPAPRELGPLVGAIAAAVAGLGGTAPVLVGHSFGGLLAFAVAAELETRGRQVARLVTLASASPEAWHAELDADRSSHPDADREDFVARRTARILAQGGVPPEVAGHAEYGETARAGVAVDIGLAWAGFGTATVRCPITAIRAADDRVLNPGSVAGWAAATTTTCEQVTVPGGHFFYRERPRDLIARLKMDTAD